MSHPKIESLESRKIDAAKKAKQLGYGKHVINRIEWAESLYEIDMIMISARKGEYDKYRR